VTPERWKRIEELYDRALAREPGERERFLAEACGGDEELRREVDSLLSNAEQGEDFLERPALEVAARRYVSTVMVDLTGRKLGRYEVLSRVGRGGMGEVYRARDTRLKRQVALKVLPPERLADPERKRRFEQEARAASALDHPNIVTIHDIDQAEGIEFIAMEYVEGQTLAERIGRKGLPVPEALKYAVQIADALAAAHQAGIVHRDLKPANMMVTEKGTVKVLDFGLAKLTEPPQQEGEASTETARASTVEGTVLGTVAYMSPEQVQGLAVDARSDVFAFGSVLYEMLTGRQPFQGESTISTMSAILRDTPEPVTKVRHEVPPDVERIVRRCLEKDREARYRSGAELCKDVEACGSRFTARQRGLRAMLRRPRVLVFSAAILLVLVGAVAWLWIHGARVRWARNVALQEIARLVEEGKNVAAFRLALEAEKYITGDPRLVQLLDEFSQLSAITTTPPGAVVELREYSAGADEWIRLGATPLETVRLPLGYFRWRISKPGLGTFETAQSAGPRISFRLEAVLLVPEGMVTVIGGTLGAGTFASVGSLGPYPIGQYFIDRYEVTNKQYQQFVDAGGYQRRQYWKERFSKEGQSISWEQAMDMFRDATGRPGPATWEGGRYPEGRGDFPVAGVSWYEAAAYAEFAKKSLPTLAHWYWAAGLPASQYIVPLSNFGGGPAAVGTHRGAGPSGTFDMAGNVKEWCWNATDGRRFLLGGAWNEPSYMFWEADARPPFDRSPNLGFRCVRYTAPPPEQLLAPRQRLFRDYTKEKPSGDDLFRTYERMYAYDRTELRPKVESADDSSPYWKKEKISFNAAYGNERVIAYLFLPKNAVPPHQTIVFFPGANALALRSSSALAAMQYVEYVIKSGRALLYPIYQETHERWRSPDDPPTSGRATSAGISLIHRRDRILKWYKDLARSIDYLETRPDIDLGKLGYLGVSMGAAHGPIFAALESRLATCVFLNGGMYLRESLPESDQLNFAPRVKMPVLMLNGRYDFIFPVETSQRVLFRLLGTPAAHKRYVLLNGSHDFGNQEMDAKREMLQWLDRYLGPVKAAPPGETRR